MGGLYLVGDQFLIGGAKPQVTEWGPNLKSKKKVFTGWKAEFVPKIR